MGIRNYVKNTFKANTNVKGWSSWNTVKDSGQAVKRLLTDLKGDNQIGESAEKLTFEQAAQKSGFTDSDLVQQAKSHWIVAIVCLLLGAGAIGWTTYLLLKGMLLSSLMALSLALLMFSYAFREHFTYFQIKQKRLDCTVKDWMLHFFKGSK